MKVLIITDVQHDFMPGGCLAVAHGLNQDKIEAVFHKGSDPNVDSYSSFFDEARHRSTGLEDYLRKHGLTDLYFVGLATDYCILYSVLDALALGFSVNVMIDACRAINLHPEDEAKAIELMRKRGAEIVQIAS